MTLQLYKKKLTAPMDAPYTTPLFLKCERFSIDKIFTNRIAYYNCLFQNTFF